MTVRESVLLISPFGLVHRHVASSSSDMRNVTDTHTYRDRQTDIHSYTDCSHMTVRESVLLISPFGLVHRHVASSSSDMRNVTDTHTYRDRQTDIHSYTDCSHMTVRESVLLISPFGLVHRHVASSSSDMRNVTVAVFFVTGLCIGRHAHR